MGKVQGASWVFLSSFLRVSPNSVSGERVRGRENRDGLVLVEESGRGGAEDEAERNHGLEASQVEGVAGGWG